VCKILPPGLSERRRKVPPNQRFRIGGLVEQGSVKKDGTQVQFVVTDLNAKITVRYEGILPDLFREGQGVVAQGQLVASNQFMADEVLAKHDENYMPPEVADILSKPVKKPAGGYYPHTEAQRGGQSR
jgi:cytochrome c-type biogenesis protein CcmE